MLDSGEAMSVAADVSGFLKRQGLSKPPESISSKCDCGSEVAGAEDNDAGDCYWCFRCKKELRMESVTWGRFKFSAT